MTKLTRDAVVKIAINENDKKPSAINFYDYESGKIIDVFEYVGRTSAIIDFIERVATENLFNMIKVEILY
jgi:hypothetical protein